jgi:solute:Na+ symporter, SSS family
MQWADLIVMLAYLALTAGLALWFTKRNSDTEAYFVGNRGFAGWALGLSMLGTIVSSATFLALPAAAFVLDWRQLAVNLPLPFIAVLAVLVFVPMFRRGRMTTAFEYLGLRYGKLPRLYGTLSFIVMQLIRSAQVLFLMALPIQFMTGLPIRTVIIGTGLFVAFYTVVGGITAVIWTTVVQTIIMLIGGIICVAYIVTTLPGGMREIVEVGMQHSKFSLGCMDWDITQRTFWTVTLLGVVNWLAIFGGDQNMVQRYVSARSTREAKKAVLVYTVLALPIWTLFFFVGTSLFVFYKTFPDEKISGLAANEILPYFILNRIPDGLSGLIIAAIVAAAMSTLGACINAVSTVTVVDILKPNFTKKQSDRFHLVAALLISAFASTFIIGGALFFTAIPKESMNDISLIVTSVFGGCLMGLFILGFFTRRIDGFAANCALVTAMLLNIYLGLGAIGLIPASLRLAVHSYWVGALVNLCFMSVAYIVALVRNKPPVALTGLTIWTSASADKP